MKQLAAIIFLIIILFDFYGYRALISYMQSSSSAFLEKKVDENRYEEADVITIKTKLNLPYYISSAEYTRAYGSVSINGINYQYVKRRAYNDTLELVCLPNETSTKLQSVKNEMTKVLSEGQTSSSKKNQTIRISLPTFFEAFRTFSLIFFFKQKPAFIDHAYPMSSGYCLEERKPPRPFRVIS